MNFPFGYTPELRANFDIIFTNMGTDSSIEKRLSDHYFGCLPNFKSFRCIYEQVCNNQTTYLSVVNRFKRPSSILDKLKWIGVSNNAQITRFPKISIESL